MAQRGGKRDGAGRKVGTPNKRTEREAAMVATTGILIVAASDENLCRSP